MNDRAKPSTAKEALIAEILGDLDQILSRSEALPKALKESETAFLASVAALDAGGDRYRMAITQFNEEAKRDIQGALERGIAKAVNEQSLAMQEAARQAFLGEGASQSTALRQALARVAEEIAQLGRSRTRDIILSSIISGIVCGVLVFVMLKLK